MAASMSASSRANMCCQSSSRSTRLPASAGTPIVRSHISASRLVVGFEAVPVDEAPLADVVRAKHERLGELGESPGPTPAEPQFAEHEVEQRSDERHREHDHDPGQRFAGAGGAA